MSAETSTTNDVKLSSGSVSNNAFALCDIELISFANFEKCVCLRAINWNEIFTAILNVIDNNMPIDDIAYDDKIIPNNLHEKLRSKTWIWSGFGCTNNLNAKDIKASYPDFDDNCDTICDGLKFSNSNSDSSSSVITANNQIFVLQHNAKQFSDNIALYYKNSSIKTLIEIEPGSTKLLICGDQISKLIINYSNRSLVSVTGLVCDILRPKWHELFDFTPIPRDPAHEFLWDQIDRLYELERNMNAEISYELGSVISDMNDCQTDYHLVFLSSTVGSTKHNFDDKKNLPANRELLLDAAESRFYGYCKHTFSQVNCHIVNCISEPIIENNEKDNAENNYYRSYAHFQLSDYNQSSKLFSCHYPYPTDSVLYGTRIKTEMSGDERCDILKVLALVIKI